MKFKKIAAGFGPSSGYPAANVESAISELAHVDRDSVARLPVNRQHNLDFAFAAQGGRQLDVHLVEAGELRLSAGKEHRRIDAADRRLDVREAAILLQPRTEECDHDGIACCTEVNRRGDTSRSG